MRYQWTLLFLLCSFLLAAQSPSLFEFNSRRLDINQAGMQVLGGWALLNMAWSASQLNSADPLKQSYHQMNLAWNGVNLAIAGFGWYQSQQNQEIWTLVESLSEQNKIERILAVNAALDVVYIMGGLYLQEYANRNENPSRFKGFGRSIIVNGAFLLGFDLIMYYLHHQHQLEALLPILDKVQISSSSVGVRIPL